MADRPLHRRASGKQGWTCFYRAFTCLAILSEHVESQSVWRRSFFSLISVGFRLNDGMCARSLWINGMYNLSGDFGETTSFTALGTCHETGPFS